jgi:hypothetical protein
VEVFVVRVLRENGEETNPNLYNGKGANIPHNCGGEK